MMQTPQLRFPEFTDEWQLKKFGESLESISSGKSNTTSNGTKYPIYGSTGEIGKSATCDYSGDKLLIARVGANAGSMYRVSGSYKVSDNTLIVNLKDDVDTLFVQYSLINFNINRLVFGSGQPLVTGGMLKNTKLAFPSKPEQEKIADFLAAVDERIGVSEKKLELLETYKRGAMQKIFSQQVRFKDCTGNLYPDWEDKKAGALFRNISNRKHNGELPVLSITQDDGVVQRDSLERKINQSDTGVKNYKIIEPNDFVISLRSFQGGIEMSNILGISSPAYTVLRGNSDVIPGMFKHYFKRDEFISKLNSTVVGIRDGKQISYEPFSTIRLPVPCTEEQQKIATFLTTLDDKITAEKSKLTATRKFKKALLQRMFV